MEGFFTDLLHRPFALFGVSFILLWLCVRFVRHCVYRYKVFSWRKRGCGGKL